MKRVIIPIVIALVIIACCVFYLNYDTSINSGTEDILYNEIVYERSDFTSYNTEVIEDNSKYIGDFAQLYAYGQEVLYEVRVLNDDANVLYSAHAVWLKPGHVTPGDFGEEFASVAYVVPEGLDFLVIEDDYSEEVTPLATFDGVVKLEDIVEVEASEVTDVTLHNYIRFAFKNYADITLGYALCESDGKYCLNVCKSGTGEDEFHEIKAEYVELLTSAIDKAK
jgi:hypothetical protein